MMTTLETLIEDYLDFCRYQKRLDPKTLKAYRIDLRQFREQLSVACVSQVSLEMLENFIGSLHQSFKPKTVKRKIASLKAFFHYLEYRDVIDVNPFNKIHTKFREPVILPKVIPLHTIKTFLATMYEQRERAGDDGENKKILRDIAVIEVLFSTGMRVSELCSLRPEDVDLQDGVILISGKGSKERRIQIGSGDVLLVLQEYKLKFRLEMAECQFFFVNRVGRRLSEQSVREMINKYCSLAAIRMHITPHMFRHSFATFLLESDVDIRYIQEMLGHSSINVTEIYTHVALAKQKDILRTKHPRTGFGFGRKRET